MGRNLDDVLAALPEARAQALHDEVEGLRELRALAGKAQVEIASALDVKQPSVSKIEKQTDMYVSTLRSYVEAVGGELELVVRLPARPPLRIGRLGDVSAHSDAPRGPLPPGRRSPAKARKAAG